MTRRQSLLLIVVLLTSCARGVEGQVGTVDSSLGLIVLSKSFGNKDFVHIYNEDGNLWHEFTFYNSESGGKSGHANEDFLPFAFHQDYFLLALKCVRKEAGRYEVLVNEETGLKKYVKADDASLTFEEWADHILRTFSVRPDRTDNPVLETRQGRIKKGVPLDVPFHPVEIRGEWLKVKWETADGLEQDGVKYDFGWVKWKSGDRLLVELFYFA